jgi:hypothetical protein
MTLDQNVMAVPLQVDMDRNIPGAGKLQIRVFLLPVGKPFLAHFEVEIKPCLTEAGDADVQAFRVHIKIYYKYFILNKLFSLSRNSPDRAGVGQIMITAHPLANCNCISI